MLGKWFRNRWRVGAIRSGRIEMTQFLNHIENVADRDVGPLVAVAAVIRVNLENMDMIPRGLFDIERVHDLDPKYKAQMRLSGLAMQFERRKQHTDNIGTKVLLHTLRALAFPELRDLGRDMWRELRRGFRHVEDTFVLVEETKGKPLDPRVREECRVIPRGLEADEPDGATPDRTPEGE